MTDDIVIPYDALMCEKSLELFTDGGCSGNPGPGGWAFVVRNQHGIVASRSGGEQFTTNNKMELQAVIQGLAYIHSNFNKGIAVTVYTDSQYVKNGISVWIHTWKKNGWKTASKAPVKNKDLWIQLDDIRQHLTVTWHWVKGHAGIDLNEMCDTLVRKEMDLLISTSM